VRRYLSVNEKALKFMKEHPEETYAMVAKEIKLSVEIVKEMVPWYDFNPTITDSDLKDMEATQDFLLENDMMQNKIKISDLVVKDIN